MDKLTISNPRTEWVRSELLLLISEWEEWQKQVAAIKDHPYDRNTHTDVFADGEENMEKHAILQRKTSTFLENNLAGHWFVGGASSKSCDRTDLRLNIRVKHRLRELREIEASLPYAKLTDSYWKQKGKEVIDKIADQSPEVALEIMASYLRNPIDGE